MYKWVNFHDLKDSKKIIENNETKYMYYLKFFAFSKFLCCSRNVDLDFGARVTSFTVCSNLCIADALSP